MQLCGVPQWTAQTTATIPLLPEYSIPRLPTPAMHQDTVYACITNEGPEGVVLNTEVIILVPAISRRPQRLHICVKACTDPSHGYAFHQFRLHITARITVIDNDLWTPPLHLNSPLACI